MLLLKTYARVLQQSFAKIVPIPKKQAKFIKSHFYYEHTVHTKKWTAIPSSCIKYKVDVYSFSILFSFPVVYCGPTEWRFERRRGSSSDRKNTVRHLMQMMSISESNHEDEFEEDSDENLNQDIPDEFIDLYKDEELRKTLVRSHSHPDILGKGKKYCFP